MDGEDLAGVSSGRGFPQGRRPWTGPTRRATGVVVVGGGNVAVDAARTALRLGSREVTILYRRTRAEMPAYDEEIEEALEEGIRIEYLAAPVKLVGQDGRLTGVQAVRMELGEPDSSGRRRPMPVPGSEYLIEADAVLSAIGQAPGPRFPGRRVFDRRGTRFSSGGRPGDPADGPTPWIFAGGDAVTGPADVVLAIGAGKRAAESIRRFIDGEDLSAGRDPDRQIARGQTEGLPRLPRQKPPLAPAASRTKSFDEVMGVFDRESSPGRSFPLPLLRHLQRMPALRGLLPGQGHPARRPARRFGTERWRGSSWRRASVPLMRG